MRIGISVGILVIFCSIATGQEFSLKEGLMKNLLPLENDLVLMLARQYKATIMPSDIEFLNFLQSLITIRLHNEKKNATYTLDIDSPFAFISDEEFQTKYLGAQNCSATASHTLNNPQKIPINNKQVPNNIDWKALNKVSPVKDQQNCGSCWAFSTTGAIESHYAILQKQQLLDCSADFQNFGCGGGLPSHAFEYIKNAGGIAFENSYIYSAQQEQCQFQSSTIGSRVKGGSFNITSGDEQQLKVAVGTVGPVSIAFEVMPDMKLYKSGIYSNPKCSSSAQTVNHAVLAVGYGTENGQNYWYVKNSWSEYWGDEGYFKIHRGNNMCGVATCASYPLLNEIPNFKSKQYQYAI